MCPKEQTINIHTDSERAIHTIIQPNSTAKFKVRTNYQAEKEIIKTTITKQKINFHIHKVKAHQTSENQQADTLAKKETTSIIQYIPNSPSPTLINQSQHPASQDPRKWIKHKYQLKQLLEWQTQHLHKYLDSNTISQMDWKATKTAWEEDGALTSGPNTFKGTRTRTFKIKALHQRLPTAHRKQIMNPAYPTNKCLHCTEV